MMAAKDDIFGSVCIDLIRRGFDWKSVEYYCEHKPSIIKLTRTSGNNTILHEVCNVGSAPIHVIEKILSVCGLATNVQNKYGDTPLHVATRAAQRSSNKVKLLMEFNPSALLIKNNTGYSPLATAIVSRAFLPVIQMIAEKEPSLLLAEDENNRSPVQLLISSFQKNIPGSLALRSYLKDRLMRNILRGFWTKLQYLLMRTYERKLGKNFGSIDNSMICHAILAEGIKGESLKQVLAIALSIDRTHALQVEAEFGKCPLHILAKQKEFIAAKEVLKRCPDAVMVKDFRGRLPLHIAMNRDAIQRSESVKEKEKWGINVANFVSANPEALECQDTCGATIGFYPFMIAAVEEDLQLTFDMLLGNPGVIVIN
jgi:ankyrin repeat protein